MTYWFLLSPSPGGEHISPRLLPESFAYAMPWGKLAFSREAFSTSVTKHPPVRTTVDSHPRLSSHSTLEQQNWSDGFTRCTNPFCNISTSACLDSTETNFMTSNISLCNVASLFLASPGKSYGQRSKYVWSLIFFHSPDIFIAVWLQIMLTTILKITHEQSYLYLHPVHLSSVGAPKLDNLPFYFWYSFR